MIKYKIETGLEAGQSTMTWKPDHEKKWSGKEIHTREDETDDDGLVLVARDFPRTPGKIWSGNFSAPVGDLTGGTIRLGFFPGKEEGFGSSARAVQQLEALARELVVLLEKVEADAAAPSTSEWKTL